MSLERKIILSFLISFTLITLLAIAGAVTFGEIKREIAYLELSDTLRGKTLLLRRHEKNFFLYGERKERENVILYLGEVRDILKAERPRYPTTDLEGLERDIAEYRECFARIEALAAAVRQDLARLEPLHPRHALFLPLADAVLLERPLAVEEVLAGVLPPEARGALSANLRALDTEIGLLRKNGEEIITFSANIDRTAREKADHALRRSQTAALLLFPLSVLVGLGSLFFISHSVVRRLKLLTEVIEQTGRGEFTAVTLPEDGDEDEVGVLVNAVTTMQRELVHRDEEIARKNEELLRGRKLAAIGTLAAGVAHELNNPLNNISLSAQVLARQVDPAAATPLVREIVGDILAETQRVKRIVGDLLEFAREKPPDLRRVDLAALLRETVAGMAPGVPAGVAFRLEAPAECWVLADAHLLTQIFVNLLANAAESMGAAGGGVEIALAAADGAARVEVRDSGRGIHPDDLQKVFDPFFTTKEKGTGLGLAIVYNSVKKLGGSIDVRSELEHGTTFVITLPGAP
jgi:signal transduction histidine kinase